MRRVGFLIAAGLIWVASACDDTPVGFTIQTESDVGGEEDGGEGGDVAGNPDTGRVVEETPPILVAGIETIVRQTEVAAGTVIYVTCQPLGEDGEPVLPDEPIEKTLRVAPMDSFGVPDSEDPLVVMPTRVGEVTIGCAVPALGLLDVTPAVLVVTAGRPYTAVTTISPSVIVAGEQISAECEVYDAFGNAIAEPRVTLRVTPDSSGVRIGGQTALVERSGVYSATCDVRGARNIIGDEFEVLPGLPASLAMGLEPDQRVYRTGQVIAVSPTVADRYNNVIHRPNFRVTSDPDVGGFGQARFRFEEEGTYDLTGRIQGPTEGGVALRAEAQVIVNGTGPSIQCDEPIDGAILDMRPGNEILFRGAVADVHGVQSVQVNGRTIIPDEQGRFETEFSTRYGINFVDLVATDNLGVSSTRTCAFLVADQWALEGEFLADAVTLRLAQEAIDDRNTADGLDSLNDLLHTVLNSPGLESELDMALRGENPLYPRQCVERFIICLTYLEVNYTGLDLGGPNAVSLTLVNGGLRAVATIRDIEMGLRIGGTWNTSGTVSLEDITVDMTFDMGLNNGRPEVGLRRVNSVTVGRVETDFSGVVGFILDIIAGLFEGRVRNLIRDKLRDYVQESFNDVLDGAVGGLDITSLGSSFQVPRPGGGEDIELTFGIEFSSLSVSRERALFGVGTRLSGPVSHGGFTRGAPIPAGVVRNDPVTQRAAAASISMGVLSQALHTLWRAGLFDAGIQGADVGDAEGASVTIRTNLPPVVNNLGGGQVQLMLGAIRAEVVYPGVIDVPLALSMGAVAEARVEVVNNGTEFRFGDVEVTELYFSAEDGTLTPGGRAVLEGFLGRVIQSLVDSSLNDALPAIPIPMFTLPEDLARFGIPPGAQLGLVEPQLSHTSTHIVLEAAFGVQ
jgi:hypothetical protein